MSDATLARMEHGKYVGVRGEPRRDGVYVLRKPTLYVYVARRQVSGALTQYTVHTNTNQN